MKSLEGMLQAVNSAVKRADFECLARLAPALDAALADIETNHTPPPQLARILRAAEHNALLLEAARRGLRAARRRIEDTRRASSGLQTYDVRGQRADIVTGSKTAGRF